MESRGRVILLGLLLLLLTISTRARAEAPTDPYKGSTALVLVDNKFRNKKPVDLENILFGTDLADDGDAELNTCHFEVDVAWVADLGASVQSTPIIADVKHDGSKEVICNTIRHFVEVLEGEDGHKEDGSPATFDAKGDGVDEVVVVTKDGEIVFIDHDGVPLYNRTIKISYLRVPRYWYEGLEGEDIIACLALNSKMAVPYYGDAVRDDPKSAPTKSTNDDTKVTAREVFSNMEGWLTPDGIDSLELFLPTQTSDNFVQHLIGQQDPLHVPTFQKPRELVTAGYVYLKPSILSSSAIADLDQDGRDEIILTVSYMLQRTDLGPNAPADFDPRKYVAGAVVAVELETGRVKFTTPILRTHLCGHALTHGPALDLTTDKTEYRSYLAAAPLIVDINGDGKYDVIVGTGVGYIYAVNHQGVPYEDQWPLVLDAVIGDIAVEDVTGDGKLDIIATDSNSNLVVFQLDGSVAWERRISGVVYGGPTMGDVDGDGVLDIVIATSLGHVWAVYDAPSILNVMPDDQPSNGQTGATLQHFPIRVDENLTESTARTHGSPLLLRLHPGDSHLGVIVGSTDGHLYIIDGKSACLEQLDFGERTTSMVLADDVTGNGYTDLIVSTNQGHVICVTTTIRHEPRNEWGSESHGRNVRTSKYHQSAFFVRDYLEVKRLDVVGDSFTVQIRIVDERKNVNNRAYRVKDTYFSPGFYSLTLDTPGAQREGALELDMMNEVMQHFEDSLPISFNRHFDRSIKWALFVPLLAMAMAIAYLQPSQRPLRRSSSSL